MGLDIRLPIGLMFSILGILLTGYGLFADSAIYERSLGQNVNLWWGLIMLLFGLVMLYLGRRGTSAMRPAQTGTEGRAIEKREAQTGLESKNPLTEK